MIKIPSAVHYNDVSASYHIDNDELRQAAIPSAVPPQADVAISGSIEDILTSQSVYATSMNLSRLSDGRFRATVLRKSGDWYRVAGPSVAAVIEEMAHVCKRGDE